MKLRLVVVSLLALHVGCSSTGGPDTSEMPDTIPIVGIPNHASPTQRAVFGAPEHWVARQAVAKQATAQCMLERGWRGFPPTTSLVELPETVEEHHTDGEQFGYGIATRLEQDRTTTEGDPGKAAFWGLLTDDERERVNRDLWAAADDALPGCMYVGHLVAFGNVDFLEAGYGNAQADASSKRRQDPLYLSARQAWSSCVKDAGEDFAEPSDIVNDLQARLTEIDAAMDRPAASSDPAIRKLMTEELRLYGIDQRCDAMVGLTVTSLAVQDRIEAGYVDDPVFADNSLPPLPSD